MIRPTVRTTLLIAALCSTSALVSLTWAQKPRALRVAQGKAREVKPPAEEPKAAPIPMDAPQAAIFKDVANYQGAEACILCHRDNAENFRNEMILADEVKTWEEKDPHASAYSVLLGKASQQMEASLGWKAGQAATEDACLVCHSNVAVKSDPKLLAEGVSCEVCHGPFAKWNEVHADKSFRTYSHKQWLDVGYRPIAHATSRADLCSSCHVGDETRRVTHAMYAAGHPPLPPFELSTFLARMPHHWKDAKDLPPEVQTHRGLDKSPIVALQDVAAGAILNLDRTVSAFAHGVRSDAAPSRVMAGFESYDCASCHHELRVRDGQAYRNRRGSVAGEDFFDWRVPVHPTLPPGRLRPTLSAFELPALVAGLGPKPPAIGWVVEEYVLSVSQGRLDGVTAASKWSEQVSKDLFASDGLPKPAFDQSAADRFLSWTLNRGVKESLSFDSARILVGSFRSVLKDRYTDWQERPNVVLPLGILSDTLALDTVWPTRMAGTDPKQPVDEGPVLQTLAQDSLKRSTYRPRVIRDAFLQLQSALNLPDAQ